MPTSTRKAVQNLTQRDVDAIRQRVWRFLRDGDIAPSAEEFTAGLIAACRQHGHILDGSRDAGRMPLFYDKAAAVIMRPLLLSLESRYVDDESKMHVAEVREGPEAVLNASVRKIDEYLNQ